MAFRTLEDLRNELRLRIGFGAAGASAGVNQPLLSSFLRTAYHALYEIHDWVKMKKYSDKTLGIDECLIDYPTECNPDRVLAISVKDGSLWTTPLERGIRPQHYTYQENHTRPTRWEPYQQIEFNVKADKAYTVRVFYIQNLNRFVQDDDRPLIDDNLVFQFALADAKAHYRHPDWEIYARQREAILNKLKARSWGQRVFRPEEYTCYDEPLPKPVVV